MSRWTQAARICLDLVLFAVVCFAEFVIHNWMEPVRRGFFCSDESLQYPYRRSTVGLLLLASLVLGLPALVLLCVELFRQLPPSAERRQAAASASGCRLGHRVAQCCRHFGYYLFGLALTLVATELGKVCVGRLRPHFFAVCQPQMADGSSCSDAANHGRYIEEYTCLGATNGTFSAHTIHEVTMSFPSGHASIFFYAMLYVSIYLQAALSSRASKLLKHLLQFLGVMLAWYVALTRISDYWHHWTDVVAGAALGVAVALLVSILVADVFGRGRRRGGAAGGGGGAAASPGNAKASATTPPNGKPSASTSSSAKSAATVLPAYTFGTMPYLHHPHHPYGQTYHNYGYVP